MSQLFAMRTIAESPHDVRRSSVAAPSSDMNGDASVELLRTMAEVLDIRAVFPRVSAITSQVLAHDALALVFVDAANSLRLEARSTDDVPQFTRLVLEGDRDFSVVTELRASRFRFGLCQPADLVAQLANAGYRSLAVVGSFARRQAIGLIFLSKEPAAFSVADGACGAQDCRLRRAGDLASAVGGRRTAESGGAVSRRAHGCCGCRRQPCVTHITQHLCRSSVNPRSGKLC